MRRASSPTRKNRRPCLFARPTCHGRRSAFRAKTLESDLDVTGSIAQPNAKLRVLIEDAAFSAGRLGHVDAAATALADGPLTDAASHVVLDIKARGDELAFTDRGLGDALGDGRLLRYKHGRRELATLTLDSPKSKRPPQSDLLPARPVLTRWTARRIWRRRTCRASRG